MSYKRLKDTDYDLLDIIAFIALLIQLVATIALLVIFFVVIFDCAKETKAEAMQVQIISGSKVIPKEEEEPVIYYDVPLDEEVQDYIRETAEYYEVPMPLVMAIIQCESGFQPDIISSTHDYGLMQINRCNLEWLADELGITDILDPTQNILCGIHLISIHVHDSEDIQEALLKYNCGKVGAERLMSQGIYSTHYTEKIMAAYRIYLSEEKEKSLARAEGKTLYQG